MSRRTGGIIGPRPAWTTTATSGIFTLGEVADLKAASQWPRGPVAPTSLACTGGDTQVALTWVAPATTHGTITDYAVEYTPSGGSPTVVLTGSTAASYTATGLTNGTEYTFRVAAINHTQGEWSATATATPTQNAAPLNTELMLNMNNSLADASQNNYVFNSTHSLNPGFDSTNKVFGSHSRIYQPYSSDSLSNQGAAVVSMFTGDFTVECFYRLNSGVLGNTIYSGGVWGVVDSSGNSFDNMALYIDTYSSNYIAFYWYNGANSSGSIYSATAMIDDGAFRHLAVVREGTTFRVYYDGNRIIENTSANNADPWTTQSLSLSVGIDPYMAGYDGTDGNIDDFRISSAALYSGATINVPTSELT
jgi:hypothetical protein